MMEIHATEHPSGSHWETMGPVAGHLTHVLADMAAAFRVYCGDATTEDLSRLELDEPTGEPADAAYGWLDGWALEIQSARWEPGTGGNDERTLAVLYFLLGTGGPHVELECRYDTTGTLAVIELRRYWSGGDRAWTTDREALDVDNRFAPALLAEAE